MTRGISLCFAITLSMVGLVFPFLLGAQATGLNQSILLLMMLGIVGGFVYGAGFRPVRKWAQALISPVVTWPVMLVSGAALLAIG